MTSFHKARYGSWAGNPEGQKPDMSKCAQEIMERGGWHFYQCTRSRGHGPEQAFCKTHAKKHRETDNG